jgi:rhamnogalacturonyl hydrolase YesR
MVQYLTARIAASPAIPPEGKRFPFGWSAFALQPNGELPHLTWDSRMPVETDCRLRLTVALDDREEKLVEVVLAESGQHIATVDLRYADFLQTFEVVLAETDTRRVRTEGIVLRLTQGTTPLYLFHSLNVEMPDLLSPHLLIGESKDRWTAFQNRLCSLDSLEPFGWHEGCVLDGLTDLAQTFPESNAATAIYQHLGKFLSDTGELVYEDPHSSIHDGRIYGIECTLPFATIARFYPEHRLLTLATLFWKERIARHGAVADGKTITAEGMYTVAYPMAVLARQRGNESLALAAVHELRMRRERLLVGDDLYLRFNAVTGERTFRNWSRGVAWYLLGLVRTLIVLEGQPNLSDVQEELERVAQWVVGYQSEGLWHCYLDDSDTRPETSGSAGIAAALALGVQSGLLDPELRLYAEQTRTALLPYLTPDGLLTGVSQSNKGGEVLQQSRYRVIKKTGMGLVGILLAALGADR